MSDTMPPAPAAVPEPVDLRRALADGMVKRKFRLTEVCSELSIEPQKALEVMMDPEYQANIDRLVATGNYAGEVAEGRELLEILTSDARTTLADFILLAKNADLGPQSIAAFIKARQGSIALLAKLKYPSLKALLRGVEKERKRKGQSTDRASIHRALASLLHVPTMRKPSE